MCYTTYSEGNGADGEVRTLDLFITNEVLYH
jgi:hypothetical protein